MDNVFNYTKRLVAISVSFATILWAVGVAAFIAPATAQAASMGDLIKGESLSTVYYYGFDGSRYTFPNEKTFMTWFEDFDSVVEISDSDLADITLAGNAVYRPGSRWIKITSADEVYAVSTDGSIHWIESEDVAMDLAGDDWNQNIDDVPDVFFVDYSSGASLMTATAFDGMMWMDGGDYYLAWDGEMRMVSEDGREANRMQDRFFLDGEGIDASALSSGDDIDSEVSAVTDVAQQGGDDSDDDSSSDEAALEVSVSSSTPAGATLPKGANSVEVFSFDLEAGDEDAEVDSVTLTYSGVGATSNVSNVYLYEGSSRLTDARSVNSSTRTVTFGSLGWEVDANDTRTISVRVEVSSSASSGDEIAFSIDSADDVDGADVSGDFPAEGNSFAIANTSAGTVTVTKSGTITNPSIGEQDAVIGKFKIAASSEDASVEMVTLKIDNAADHDDFWLWVDGEAIAEGEYLGDKLVSFDFSDDTVEISDGNSEIFSVSADVGGDASDAVKVYVDNAVDVVAVGGDYGFGMTADIATSGTYDGTSCTSSSGNCSYSTLQGGEVTFSMSGPSAGEIRTNSQDQTLLEFTLTSAQDITVKDLDIIVYGDDDGDSDATDAGDDATSDADGLFNSSDANITDIKIIDLDTGDTVMGPLELDGTTHGTDDDADQTIDFTDDFSVEAGETLNLAVTVDVDADVTSGTEFAAALDISGFVAEDANGDNLTNSTDVVPTTDLTGYNQEALAASLTISLASTPGDVSTVQGMDDVVVNRFNFIGGDAGEVMISEITLSAYADDDGTGTFTLGDVSGADVNDYVESCSLYDVDGNLLDGPESPATGGATLTFSDVDWTIAAGENEQLEVQCDFANPSDTDADYFAFDLDDVSEDVVAEDAEGVDVDPTSDDPNGGTSPTNVVTVNASGTLTVAKDSSTPSSYFVMTGSSSNEVAVYKLTATNEDFEVSTFTVSEEQAEDDTGSTDSSAYANNIERVWISYPLEDGSTGTASATMNGNEAEFNLTTDPIWVSTGDEALVTVSVDVPETDRSTGGSATSNEFIRMAFHGEDADDFEAVGVGSGVTKTGSDVSSIGDDSVGTDGIYTFVVRETIPTIALNDNSPSGSNLTVSDREVLRFDVSAAANEDVVLRELTFEISATDGASVATGWNQCDVDNHSMETSDFDFYNLSKDGVATALDTDASWTMLDANGDSCGDTEDIGYLTLDLPTPEVIPANTTYTYSLYIDLVDTNSPSASADDSLQVGIVGESDISFVDASDVNEASGVTSTATSFDVDADTLYSEGDVVCFAGGDTTCDAGEEQALVVAKSSNTLTVVRGYNATGAAAQSDNENLIRKPSGFFWDDDGDESDIDSTEGWGAYLLNILPLDGEGMSF